MLRISETALNSTLLVIAPLVGIAWLSIPREITPLNLPSLRLPKSEVAKIIRRDQKAAASIPKVESATKLLMLFLEKGQSESAPTESLQRYQQRKQRMASLLKELQKDRGEETVIAMRAQAVDLMESALALKLPADQTQKVLGAFPSYLQRHGATRDGNIVAPHFFLRTMYKMRWNSVVGFEPTYGLAKVERLAHFGWLALHTDRVPLSRRLSAVETYKQDGGKHSKEIKGVLLYHLGKFAQSAELLKQAYHQRGTIRLRNYWLGALKAARQRKM